MNSAQEQQSPVIADFLIVLFIIYSKQTAEGVIPNLSFILAGDTLHTVLKSSQYITSHCYLTISKPGLTADTFAAKT